MNSVNEQRYAREGGYNGANSPALGIETKVLLCVLTICNEIQTRNSRVFRNALLRIRDWANVDGLRLAQGFVRQLYFAAPLLRDNQSGHWFACVFTGKQFLSYLLLILLKSFTELSVGVNRGIIRVNSAFWKMVKCTMLVMLFVHELSQVVFEIHTFCYLFIENALRLGIDGPNDDGPNVGDAVVGADDPVEQVEHVDEHDEPPRRGRGRRNRRRVDYRE